MNLFADLKRRGYAIVGDIHTAQKHLAFAASLGPPLKPQYRPVVQELVPTAPENAAPNSYSARFGFSYFPFHTDCANWIAPPRFITLRSVKPSSTPTVLWDPLQALTNEDKRRLSRAVFVVRHSGRSYLCSAISLGGALRWDPVFLKPTNRLAADTLEWFAKVVPNDRSESITEIPWNVHGQVLVIDNHRTLHGRPAVDVDLERRLERVLIGG